MSKSSKAARDNRANQLNPNNDAFHSSRQDGGRIAPASKGGDGSNTPSPPSGHEADGGVSSR
jgi:hypothetical protein